MVFATVVGTLLADKGGRRILLLTSGFGMFLSLAALGLFYYLDEETNNDTSSLGWLPLVSLMVYVFTFSYGYGPMPWVFMSEVFAPEHKNIASGVNASFNWGIGFLMTTTFKPIDEAVSSCYVFWAYALFNLIGCVCVWMFLPETKGKSLQEIQQIFRGKSEVYTNPAYGSDQKAT